MRQNKTLNIPYNTLHWGKYHSIAIWLVWNWLNKLNCCSFNMINASESKQNKQEESCTVILPQKVFLVLGDQNIDQWLRPVNALLQIWRYGRLEKWGTLFACLLQIATSVNEPLVYLLQMLSLRLYVRIKEKSNYLRWYDEESFRIKTLSRKKEKKLITVWPDWAIFGSFWWHIFH